MDLRDELAAIKPLSVQQAKEFPDGLVQAQALSAAKFADGVPLSLARVWLGNHLMAQCHHAKIVPPSLDEQRRWIAQYEDSFWVTKQAA